MAQSMLCGGDFVKLKNEVICACAPGSLRGSGVRSAQSELQLLGIKGHFYS